MLNTTILFFSLSSIQKSPYLMIPFSEKTTRLTLSKSIFSRFTSSFLQTYTNDHRVLIDHIIFKYFISTPLIFDSVCNIGNDNTFQAEKPIKGINFTSSKFAIGNRVLLTTCGNIIIVGCQFIDLENQDSNAEEGIHSSGGGLFIGQDSTVELYNCLFSNCRSYDNGGGAYIAAKKTDSDKSKPENYDDPLLKLNATYCCFQRCYFKKEGKYGTAMYMSAKNTHLSFASTSQCPIDTTNLPNGAQFDMHSPLEITSSNVNTTGGYAKYCSAIEYRNANHGYFKFQTVVKMVGKFSTSFNNLETDFDISNCNYVDNTVSSPEESKDNPALIHIRDRSVTITNFYFLNTAFITNNNIGEDRLKIIGVNDGYKNTVQLINCYSNLPDDKVSEKFYGILYEGNLVNDPNKQFETFKIPQLLLGECVGDEKPKPTVITPIFTKSDFFTKSDYFTNSDYFMKSDHFTRSNAFSKSVFFSESESLKIIPIKDKDASNDGDKGIGPGALAGIIVGSVAAAAVIVGLIVFFILKKRPRVDMSDGAKVVETDDSSITVDNNLQSVMDKDDPFAEEFI